MATVPRYNSNVQQAGGGTPMANNRRYAGGGLAKGLGEIGQAVGQFAQQEARIAVAEQEALTKAEVDEAVTEFTNRKLDLLSGTEQSFYNLQRRAAYDAFEPTRAQLNTLREDIGSRLMSAPARNAYNTATRGQLSIELANARSFATSQLRQWRDDVYKGKREATIRAGVLAETPEQLADAIDTIEQDAIQRGVEQSWPEDLLRNEVFEAKAQMYGLRISNELTKDPINSLSMFERLRPQLDPVTANNLYAQIMNVVRPLDAESVATNAHEKTNVLTVAPNFDQFAALIRDVGERSPNGAVSPAGALGRMQVMPDTGRAVAAKLGIPFDAERLRTDEAYNAQIGNEYLRQQMSTFGGNPYLAAAAYNAGPGRKPTATNPGSSVQKWIARYGTPGVNISPEAWADLIEKNEAPGYKETADYVRRIAAALPPVQTEPIRTMEEGLANVRRAAAELHPGDVRFLRQAEARYKSIIQEEQTILNQKRATANDAMYAMVYPSPDNPDSNVTSQTQLFQNPQAVEAWNQMSDQQRDTWRRRIITNNRAALTQATQEDYNTFARLRGEAIRNPEAFLNQEIPTSLPISMQRQLDGMKLRTVNKKPSNITNYTNKAMGMKYVTNSLRALGITAQEDPEQLALVTGRMYNELETYLDLHEKFPQDFDTLVYQIYNHIMREGTPPGRKTPMREYQVTWKDPLQPLTDAGFSDADMSELLADFREVEGREPRNAADFMAFYNRAVAAMGAR